MNKLEASRFSFVKSELMILVALLLMAFLVRFALFANQGYQIDTADFESWFQRAAEVGPRTFYNNNYWCDYPPLNIYFFWGFGLLAKSLGVFNTGVFVYIMKILPNLFEMATAFLIFAFVRKRSTLKWALASSALYAFNPAVVFNAAVWGQFDAIYTFFSVFSLLLILDSKPKLGLAAFMLAILTKPQSIALAPLILYLVFGKTNLKGFFVSLGVALGTVIAVILPFEWTAGNPFTWLSDIYLGSYAGYQFTTMNAFNIWGFGGMWIPDSGGLNIIGWVLFGAVTALTLYLVHRKYGKTNELMVIFAAFILFFSFFMLPTRIHERYLFPAISMLALMFPFLHKTRLLYISLTTTCFVNQAYVLDALVNAYPFGPNLSGDPVVFLISSLNTLAFLYVFMLLLSELLGKTSLFRVEPKQETKKQTKERT